jgi:hypothetical protein
MRYWEIWNRGRGWELGESKKEIEEAWTGDARPWDWDFESC